MDELNLYDDLDEFQEQQEKKSKELQEAEEKYQQSLKTIEELQEENKKLKKNIQRIELGFQSLLDTARTEIKRKDKEIERLRKEKDDICFRRKIPHKAENQQLLQSEPVNNPFKSGTIQNNHIETTITETATTDPITDERNTETNKRHRVRDEERGYTSDYKRHRGAREEHDDKYQHSSHKHSKTKPKSDSEPKGSRDLYQESNSRRDYHRNRSGERRDYDKTSNRNAYSKCAKSTASPERYGRRLNRSNSREGGKFRDLERNRSHDHKNTEKYSKTSSKSPTRRNVSHSDAKRDNFQPEKSYKSTDTDKSLKRFDKDLGNPKPKVSNRKEVKNDSSQMDKANTQPPTDNKHNSEVINAKNFNKHEEQEKINKETTTTHLNIKQQVEKSENQKTKSEQELKVQSERKEQLESSSMLNIDKSSLPESNKLGTPHKVAIFNELFGQTPSDSSTTAGSCNSTNSLLHNIKDILTKTSQIEDISSATTSPADYTDISSCGLTPKPSTIEIISSGTSTPDVYNDQRTFKRIARKQVNESDIDKCFIPTSNTVQNVNTIACVDLTEIVDDNIATELDYVQIPGLDLCCQSSNNDNVSSNIQDKLLDKDFESVNAVEMAKDEVGITITDNNGTAVSDDIASTLSPKTPGVEKELHIVTNDVIIPDSLKSSSIQTFENPYNKQKSPESLKNGCSTEEKETVPETAIQPAEESRLITSSTLAATVGSQNQIKDSNRNSNEINEHLIEDGNESRVKEEQEHETQIISKDANETETKEKTANAVVSIDNTLTCSSTETQHDHEDEQNSSNMKSIDCKSPDIENSLGTQKNSQDKLLDMTVENEEQPDSTVAAELPSQASPLVAQNSSSTVAHSDPTATVELSSEAASKETESVKLNLTSLKDHETFTSLSEKINTAAEQAETSNKSEIVENKEETSSMSMATLTSLTPKLAEDEQTIEAIAIVTTTVGSAESEELPAKSTNFKDIIETAKDETSAKDVTKDSKNKEQSTELISFSVLEVDCSAKTDKETGNEMQESLTETQTEDSNREVCTQEPNTNEDNNNESTKMVTSSHSHNEIIETSSKTTTEDSKIVTPTLQSNDSLGVEGNTESKESNKQDVFETVPALDLNEKISSIENIESKFLSNMSRTSAKDAESVTPILESCETTTLEAIKDDTATKIDTLDVDEDSRKASQNNKESHVADTKEVNKSETGEQIAGLDVKDESSSNKKDKTEQESHILETSTRDSENETAALKLFESTLQDTTAGNNDLDVNEKTSTNKREVTKTEAHIAETSTKDATTEPLIRIPSISVALEVNKEEAAAKISGLQTPANLNNNKSELTKNSTTETSKHCVAVETDNDETTDKIYGEAVEEDTDETTAKIYGVVVEKMANENNSEETSLRTSTEDSKTGTSNLMACDSTELQVNKDAREKLNCIQDETTKTAAHDEKIPSKSLTNELQCQEETQNSSKSVIGKSTEEDEAFAAKSLNLLEQTLEKEETVIQKHDVAGTGSHEAETPLGRTNIDVAVTEEIEKAQPNEPEKTSLEDVTMSDSSNHIQNNIEQSPTNKEVETKTKEAQEYVSTSLEPITTCATTDREVQEDVLVTEDTKQNNSQDDAAPTDSNNKLPMEYSTEVKTKLTVENLTRIDVTAAATDATKTFPEENQIKVVSKPTQTNLAETLKQQLVTFFAKRSDEKITFKSNDKDHKIHMFPMCFFKTHKQQPAQDLENQIIENKRLTQKLSVHSVTEVVTEKLPNNSENKDKVQNESKETDIICKQTQKISDDSENDKGTEANKLLDLHKDLHKKHLTAIIKTSADVVTPKEDATSCLRNTEECVEMTITALTSSNKSQEARMQTIEIKEKPAKQTDIVVDQTQAVNDEIPIKESINRGGNEKQAPAQCDDVVNKDADLSNITTSANLATPKKQTSNSCEYKKETPVKSTASKAKLPNNYKEKLTATAISNSSMPETPDKLEEQYANKSCSDTLENTNKAGSSETPKEINVIDNKQRNTPSKQTPPDGASTVINVISNRMQKTLSDIEIAITSCKSEVDSAIKVVNKDPLPSTSGQSLHSSRGYQVDEADKEEIHLQKESSLKEVINFGDANVEYLDKSKNVLDEVLKSDKVLAVKEFNNNSICTVEQIASYDAINKDSKVSTLTKVFNIDNKRSGETEILIANLSKDPAETPQTCTPFKKLVTKEINIEGEIVEVIRIEIPQDSRAADSNKTQDTSESIKTNKQTTQIATAGECSSNKEQQSSAEISNSQNKSVLVIAAPTVGNQVCEKSPLKESQNSRKEEVEYQTPKKFAATPSLSKLTYRTVQEKDSFQTISSALPETYTTQPVLPSISTNSPTPSNFSGIFSKKSSTITSTEDDFLKSKKKSPHFSGKPKEYILPAASVLCNVDNLENATKANKKLHWELLDNKNEQTEVEDDADIDSTDEEEPKIKEEPLENASTSPKQTSPQNTTKITSYKYQKSSPSETDTQTEDESLLNDLKLQAQPYKRRNIKPSKVHKPKQCKHNKLPKSVKARLKVIGMRNADTFIDADLMIQQPFSIVLPKRPVGRPRKSVNCAEKIKVDISLPKKKRGRKPKLIHKEQLEDIDKTEINTSDQNRDHTSLDSSMPSTINNMEKSMKILSTSVERLEICDETCTSRDSVKQRKSFVKEIEDCKYEDANNTSMIYHKQDSSTDDINTENPASEQAKTKGEQESLSVKHKCQDNNNASLNTDTQTKQNEDQQIPESSRETPESRSSETNTFSSDKTDLYSVQNPLKDSSIAPPTKDSLIQQEVPSCSRETQDNRLKFDSEPEKVLSEELSQQESKEKSIKSKFLLAKPLKKKKLKSKIKNKVTNFISLEDIGIKVRPLKGHLSSFRIPKIKKDTEERIDNSWKLETYVEVEKDVGKEQVKVATEHDKDKEIQNINEVGPEKNKKDCEKDTQQSLCNISKEQETSSVKLKNLDPRMYTKIKPLDKEANEVSIQKQLNRQQSKDTSERPSQGLKDKKQPATQTFSVEQEPNGVKPNEQANKQQGKDATESPSSYIINFDNKTKTGKRKLFSPDMYDEHDKEEHAMPDSNSTEMYHEQCRYLSKTHELNPVKLRRQSLNFPKKISDSSHGTNSESSETSKPRRKIINVHRRILDSSSDEENDDAGAKKGNDFDRNTQNLETNVNEQKGAETLNKNEIEKPLRARRKSMYVESAASAAVESEANESSKPIRANRRKSMYVESPTMEPEEIKTIKPIKAVRRKSMYVESTSLEAVDSEENETNKLMKANRRKSMYVERPTQEMEEIKTIKPIRAIHRKSMYVESTSLEAVESKDNEANKLGNDDHRKSMSIESPTLDTEEIKPVKSINVPICSLEAAESEDNETNKPRKSNRRKSIYIETPTLETEEIKTVAPIIAKRRKSMYAESSGSIANVAKEIEVKEPSKASAGPQNVVDNSKVVENPKKHSVQEQLPAQAIQSFKMRRKSMYATKSETIKVPDKSFHTLTQVNAQDNTNLDTEEITKIDANQNVEISKTSSKSQKETNDIESQTNKPIASFKIRRQSMYMERNLQKNEEVVRGNDKQNVEKNVDMSGNEQTNLVSDSSAVLAEQKPIRVVRRKSTNQRSNLDTQQMDTDSDSLNVLSQQKSSKLSSKSTNQQTSIDVNKDDKKSLKSQEGKKELEEKSENSKLKFDNNQQIPSAVGSSTDKSIKTRRKSTNQRQHLDSSSVDQSTLNNPDFKKDSVGAKKPQQDIEKKSEEAKLKTDSQRKDAGSDLTIALAQQKSVKMRRKSTVERGDLSSCSSNVDKNASIDKALAAAESKQDVKTTLEGSGHNIVSSQQMKTGSETLVVSTQDKAITKRRKSTIERRNVDTVEASELNKAKYGQQKKTEEIIPTVENSKQMDPCSSSAVTLTQTKTLKTRRKSTNQTQIANASSVDKLEHVKVSTEESKAKHSQSIDADSDSSVVMTHHKSIKIRRKSTNQRRILDSSSDDNEPLIKKLTVITTEHKTPLTAAAKTTRQRKRRVVKVLSTSMESPVTNVTNISQHSSRQPSPLTSPTLSHPIFNTEVSTQSTEFAASMPMTPNQQDDNKFKEIDSKLHEIFQSPQYTVDYKISAAVDASNLTVLPPPFNDSKTNVTIDETQDFSRKPDQSSVNMSQLNDTTSTLNDTTATQSGSEIKHLSLGTADYRFEKVSDNVINLFISRKRKRKRNN